ncbi:RNA polymerase II-associated protein 1-like protein [Lachnellula arida]|uniref:RNA polymerase II-associated protein 1-like protein n=1 Tax=Lachnellula arida TaxID=1316785 RepID=A0A8T9BA69_9HELO|nr:RNA polymerase II-associated protein 1-like protein [Lachnellula arida]
MASSAPRGAERMIHQDYIARIRYSNALPPPPNPPKLLDIPNTGLASGQYTTPGFAGRLAREQPLNIEADAELGMPLDLVGMPGIFDGDESSIQAPLQLPVPHPHDRALLRPLSTLGKPKFSDSGVSFLRRTEYISSYTSKSRFDSTTSRSLIDNVGNRTKRAPQSIDKESPTYIKSQVEKSFQTAASNLKNPTAVRHPSKRNLKLVDAYPLLPDLDSFPDVGGYVTIKFLTNPVPPSTTYDIRIENSLLKPIEGTDEEEILKQQARELYERDPERNPPPDDTIEYEFFMAETPAGALNFKRKFDALDPENDDEELYTEKTGTGEGCFRFKRIRAYESAQQTGSVGDKYDEEVVVALHDGKDGLHQKGAYYYPIVQRTNIRPQRQKNINKKMKRIVMSDEVTDYVDVKVEEADEELKAARGLFAEKPYGEEEEEEAAGGEAAREVSKTPEANAEDGNASDSG